MYGCIRLSFVFEKFFALFAVKLYVSWKIGVHLVVSCRAFFSQTEYSMKENFCSLAMDEVQHLKLVMLCWF